MTEQPECLSLCIFVAFFQLKNDIIKSLRVSTKDLLES